VNTYKEMILKKFKSGVSINGLTEMIYTLLREKERVKQPKERIKYTKRDAKKIVEQTILDDMKQQYLDK